jgi:CRISPR-associated protein Cas1
MTTLLERVSHVDQLAKAWHEILENAEEADTSRELPGAVARFAASAEDRLAELSELLASDEYRPRPLTRVEFPKPAGGLRTLDIPAVADRVIERAILDVITPHVDPLLSAAAYGYRPGLGVVDAVQTVARCRDAGLTWVLRTDVDECFPTLPRDVAASSPKQRTMSRSCRCRRPTSPVSSSSARWVSLPGRGHGS